jgi:4-hydroxybenzoate polyprenyltransferase
MRDAVRHLLGASRPLSWVNTAYPFAAAYLLAGGGVDALFVLGTVYFLVPYNLLMYGVNDVFDYESDLRNPRKGGVEGLVLARRWHRTTILASVLTNVPVLVALVVLSSPATWLALAVSVAAVVAYSAPVLRFKERPVLDSMTSSTHFVSPAVVGLLAAGGSVTSTALAALAAFFLWGMASQAFGAVQDVPADRAAGIGSIATVLGAARTTRLAAGLYVAAGVVVLATGWPGALAAVLVIPYVVNVLPFRSVTDAGAEVANRGWRRFLWINYATGFLLTQLLIAVALT